MSSGASSPPPFSISISIFLKSKKSDLTKVLTYYKERHPGWTCRVPGVRKTFVDSIVKNIFLTLCAVALVSIKDDRFSKLKNISDLLSDDKEGKIMKISSFNS